MPEQPLASIEAVVSYVNYLLSEDVRITRAERLRAKSDSHVTVKPLRVPDKFIIVPFVKKESNIKTGTLCTFPLETTELKTTSLLQLQYNFHNSSTS